MPEISKRSLSQALLLGLATVATIPVLVLGWLWLSDQQRQFQQQSSAWREASLETQRRFLRQQVLDAVDYIEFKQSQVGRRLRADLRDRVDEGAALMALLAEAGEGRAGDQAIPDGQRIRELLGPLRFDGGRIHYFVLARDGTALSIPARPEWEGRDARKLRDASGRAVVKKQLQVAADGGGYIEHWSPKPGGGDDEFRTLSYVRSLPELGLVLGATGYLDEMVASVKAEVLERLGTMSRGEGSAGLFVTGYDGRGLVNPTKPELAGRSLRQLVDADGRSLFEQQLAAAARPGGEFLNFQWQREDSDRVQETLAYARGYDEWRWIISAGLFTDRLEGVLAAQREGMRERMLEHAGYIVLVVVLLLLLVVWVSIRLARRMRRGFGVLAEFFNDASRRVQPIDLSRLPYGEFVQLAEAANDMIAARRRYEEELKLNQKRFQLALDASRNHLWDIDLQRGEITFSPGFYHHLGFAGTGPHYRFDVFLSLCHPEDRERVEQALVGLLGNPPQHGLEFRLRDRQGLYRWYDSRGDVVERRQGRPIRALGTITDISARKRMEQELVAARIAAEDANHAKSQFLSSVSHELRTPLNGVLGYAQILLRDPHASPEQRESLEAIEYCGQHLLTLIDDVLDLAKIESGTIEVHPRPCDLHALLNGVADIIRQRAESKGLAFTLRLPRDLPPVIETDEVKLRQILVNLLGNAIKFTHSGSVELTAMPVAGARELVFQVSDTGVGIEPEALGRIFQPFRQASSDSGGTGLGLAISQRLCEAMGGALSVESTPGEGSCFSFNIPLHAVSMDAAPPAAPRIPQLALGDRRLTVLVVDDNATNRHVLAAMLRGSGFEILEAENGAEALARLREGPVALVLMDVRMPVMDGFAATRAIKSDPTLRHVVVIAVTASVFPEVHERMLAEGCDDFIGKPVRVHELLAKVGRHLQLPSAPVDVPGLVAHLAPEWRRRLRDAAELGAVEELEAILERLRSRTTEQLELTPLVAELQRLVANFEFAAIASMLRQAPESSALA